MIPSGLPIREPIRTPWVTGHCTDAADVERDRSVPQGEKWHDQDRHRSRGSSGRQTPMVASSMVWSAERSDSLRRGLGSFLTALR